MNKDIYTNGAYWDKNTNFHLTDSNWKANHLVSLLTSISGTVGSEDDISVCEIGCGAGGVLNEFVRLMQERGFTCNGTGYDISPPAIEKARTLFPSIHYKVADLTEINDRHHVLLLIDVLEHVNDPIDFLQRSFSIAPMVIIHLPLDSNYWERMIHGKGYYDYLIEDRGHIYYYHKVSAFKLVKSANARVIAWRYTPWGTEMNYDKSRSGRLARQLRRIGFSLNMGLSVRMLGGSSIAMVCKRGS